MKKKTLLKLFFVVSCLITACYLYSNHETAELDKFAFLNIEALASGENDEHAACLGSGSVDCRSYKVEYKVTGLSLE